MKINQPITRAILGVTALLVIVILANWLVSLTPLGSRGIDFTENKTHTLSDGTRSLLKELDTPVVIRYYATRSTYYMPEQMTLHMRRVDDLLKEYASISDGNLQVVYFDPEPDTDAEDSANLDGINGQRINGQNLYFGLAISCIDRTTTIPFLDPRDETMLEYNLSKAIADVSTPTKPKIGIMSALKVTGGPATMPGQGPSRPWILHQQLSQTYELVEIPMENPEIDPEEITVLLVIHPAGISADTEFAIDQYLLNGGTVIACLDAYSLAARMKGGGNPMMGMGGVATTSTMPNLLRAWGVSFESGMSIADPKYASNLGGDQSSIAVLTLTDEAMPQNDSIVTKGLDDVTFYIAGAFTTKSINGIATTSLVRTSNGAGLVDSMRASQLDPALNTSFRPSGKHFDLVTLLSGDFKTAFPEGKPSEGKTSKPDIGTPESLKRPKWIRQSKKTGNVFLIADVDAFYRNFAYNIQDLGGLQMASPRNSNSPLLMNIIDQATGSKHLIGSRSRTATSRPFTVINEMEAAFNAKVGEKIAELREKQEEAQRRFSQLQAQKSQGNELFLSPEQEAEIRKLRAENVKYSRLIREQQKELKRNKDQLAGSISRLNLYVMPAFVILFGLGLYTWRNRSTRAR